MSKQLNTGSPIFRLRKLIGLSQFEFAKLIGAAESSIYFVESGRLGLSQPLLERVRYATGARWEEQDKRWISVHGMAYTAKDFEDFQTPAPPEQRLRELAIMHELIDQLTVQCEDPAKWNRLVQRFEVFREQVEEDLSKIPVPPRFITGTREAKKAPRASDERQSGKGPGPGEVMPRDRKRTPAKR